MKKQFKLPDAGRCSEFRILQNEKPDAGIETANVGFLFQLVRRGGLVSFGTRPTLTFHSRSSCHSRPPRRRNPVFPPSLRMTGFTLVEVVIVIVIMGIIATVATQQMSSTVEDSRVTATKSEMEQLSYAICGNPRTWSDGARGEFGYVGDNGAFPPNLDALVTNPGLATWDGPYMDQGFSADDFKKDAWGVAYSLVGTSIRSTGSGSNIDKEVIPSSGWLTSNTISGTIVDANNQMPGSVYKDSLNVLLSYPDGSGGTATASATPNAKGVFTVSNIPVGNRTMRIVWTPDADTLTLPLCINPNKPTHVTVVFPVDLY